MSVSDLIKIGLEEAIAYEAGKLGARVTSADEILALRSKKGKIKKLRKYMLTHRSPFVLHKDRQQEISARS